MPEAGESSSAIACHTAPRAGFPWPGSPPSRLLGFFSGPSVALVALLAAILLLAPPSGAFAKSKPKATTPSSAHVPFGLAEAKGITDPALYKEVTTLVREFYETVTRRTVARVGQQAAHHHRIELILNPKQGYLEGVRADALSRLSSSGIDLSVSQYFLYADRNSATQIIFLAFYDKPNHTVRLLGADLISSGKLRVGEDSFLTPVGVFENVPGNWGYRALGTKNSKGWRGLGARGSRVWDFGWQQAPRKFRQGVRDSQMRLLMHATDPDHGETRLGGPDSKGCVRVSAAANAFLDRHSILDRRYETLPNREMDRDMWLLRADRTPTTHPGSYLVVGDSAMFSASR